MYWRLISIRFSRGRSTPAMRAILRVSEFRVPLNPGRRRANARRRRGTGLALALLVTRVRRADDPHGALALDALALVAILLDRRADLHDRTLLALEVSLSSR